MGSGELPARESLIIKGGHVLSMDRVVGDVADGDVLVQDGAITSVAKGIETPDGAAEIDATGMIVLPGFVDTHWHLWNTAMRAFIAADDPARSYFPVTVEMGPSFLPEDTYAGSRLGLAEALSCGITTVHDWCHNVRGPEFADASLRAMADTGVRGRFSYGWAQQSDMTAPMDVAGLAETQSTWFAGDAKHEGMLHLGIASRNVVRGQSLRGSITLDMARRDWSAARDLGLPITLHANPAGLVTTLEEEGLLGPDVLLVHPMLLTEQECRICAEHDTAWSMSAVDESGWELGWDPSQGMRFYELEKAGVRAGLSIDTSSFVNADFFAVMRALYRSNVHRCGTGTGVTWRRMLELATIDGARVLGIDDVTGSITPGKRADIVLVERTALNMAPVGDPVLQLGQLAEPANVHTVIADGRVLVRGGKHCALDAAEVVAAATASAHAVASRARRS